MPCGGVRHYISRAGEQKIKAKSVHIIFLKVFNSNNMNQIDILNINSTIQTYQTGINVVHF